ncbi:MAG: hypothetical protein NTW96_20675 [Planctomycetia bacterium]|nr:hypothetical protein [Planctomycetia bacterium]
MPQGMERSSLWVEGRDDLNAILHLLIRHGVDYDHKRDQLPEIQESGSVEKLLAAMSTGVELSTGRSVGFVLDADSPLADRWHAVRNQLREAGVESPESPPLEGFVGTSERYESRVGVWLMPDNEHDGKLETFLRMLIEENDALIDHATAATDQAKTIGAAFADVDRLKAILHAWLAWQEEPGCPYGTAIRARFFRRHDSPAAVRFVAWFRKLYAVAE